MPKSVYYTYLRRKISSVCYKAALLDVHYYSTKFSHSFSRSFIHYTILHSFNL
jgi:hypothetical protein